MKMSIASHPNIQMLSIVCQRLGPLSKEVAFVGGATVALYLTRSGLMPVRATRDVDIIIEVASRVRYYDFAQRLRDQGFREDVDSPVLCRWCIEDVIVDVMPVDTTILGFTNRWYPLAFETATPIEIARGQTLRLVTAPCFFATKIEAFLGRGRGDFLLSADIDDIMTILLGRMELTDEVANSPTEIRHYIAQQCEDWLQNFDFRDAIAGHLMPDAVSQAHFGFIIARLEHIAALK